MKITAIILLVACLQVSARGYAQKVTLSGKGLALDKVFVEIRKQTGYNFIYSNEILREAKRVDLNVIDTPLEDVLRLCFRDQPLTYSIVEKIIVIKVKPPVLQTVDNLPENASGVMVVKGFVAGQNNEALSGASIWIKNEKRGTMTDGRGIFELKNVSQDAVLEVSYAGYIKTEVSVKGRAMIVVQLKLSDNMMDEMQVIAYGKVSRRFNTGSVTTIKGEDIRKNPVVNVLEALQGRVPGAFIVQNTGLPGGSFSVQIRGQSSFQVNQPLYVVDGVVYPASGELPMINDALAGYSNRSINNGVINGLNRGAGNALNYLDPALIESVEVLKDADATSIYGSRGAYGVILITTRKGKPGVPRFNLNVSQGLSVRGTYPPMLNTPEYLAMRREALKNDGATVGASDLDLNGTWDTTRYTDWTKELTGDVAPTTNVRASYSGGLGGTTFLLGAHYSTMKGIQHGKGSVNDIGVNFNITMSNPSQKFTATLSGNYNSNINTMVPWDLSANGTGAAPNAPPLFLPDGKLNWAIPYNPAAPINRDYKGVTNNLVASALLRYAPIPGLSLNVSAGYNVLTSRELSTLPSSYFNPLQISYSSVSSTFGTYTRNTVNLDPYINYNTFIGRNGKFDMTLGGSLQNVVNNNSGIQGSNYLTDALLTNPSLGGTVTSSYSQSFNRQAAFFGRANYIWHQKYVLSLNGRYDGSTRFGPGKQFGTFGSVGAAWLFGDEDWVKNHLPFISFGKIRTSIGTTGGDGIGDYQYLSRFSATSTGGYQNGISLVPYVLANPDLQWETNTKKDVAVELHFLKDRINVEVNYYSNRTSNQLISQPLSTVTGFSNYTINSPALIRNTGIEGSLSTVNIQTKTFTWKTNFNIAVNRNKLLAYPAADASIFIAQNWIVGKSLSNRKLYKFAGVSPQTGFYVFTNAKGVTDNFLPFIGTGGSLNANDRTVNLDLAPKYNGGIGNTFTYKGFSLDVFIVFTSRVGPSYAAQQPLSFGFFNQNGPKDILRRWQKPGDITDVPKASQSFAALLMNSNLSYSDGAYENATYARLQNVQFAYFFPQPFLKKAHLTALSVYLQGQNLLTVSRYKNLDPENMTFGAIPPLRNFTAGINITL